VGGLGKEPSRSEDPEFTAFLGELAKAPAISLPRDGLRPGSLIDGHYEVIERIGRGGMGTVYLAHDTELERRVALKLHRAHASDRGYERLLREAQSLARLSHPNVVAVHGVGTTQGQLYMAMEYIEGSNLRRWCQLHGDATWRELLELFVDAGRGLSAAHVAGLVHRDFKPDNVLIGDDGRVCVADFGLARSSKSVPVDPAPLEAPPATPQMVDGDAEILTPFGALVGTPAYMAPEQYAPGPVDAQADQYAFCVCLWEALQGARPLWAAVGVMAGVEPSAPGSGDGPEPGRSIPRWLHSALLRGMDRDPRARHLDMDALLDELTRDRGRLRRRLIGGALVSAAICLPVLAVHLRADVVAVPAPQCVEAQLLAEVGWGQRSEGAISDAFASTGLASADTMSRRVNERLGHYAQAWASQRRSLCEARQSGLVSEASLEGRERCLDRSLVSFGALVEILSTADSEVALLAGRAVSGLPSLEACGHWTGTPDALTPDAMAVTERLDQAFPLLDTRQFELALDLIQPAIATADELGNAPIHAELRYTYALILSNIDQALLQGDEALQAAERATRVAMTTSAVAHQIASAGLLGQLLAKRGNHHREAALRWLALADALHAAGGDADSAAKLASMKTIAFNNLGMWPQALAAAREGVEAARRGDQTNRHTNSIALDNLGVAQAKAGHHADAVETFEASYQTHVTEFGPSHPAVSRQLANLSAALAKAGDLERAQETGERALEVLERTYRPDHPTVLGARGNFGVLLLRIGRVDEGLAQLTFVHRATVRAAGEESLGAATSAGNLAIAHVGVGRLERAEALATESRRVLELLDDSRSPRVINALAIEGHIQRARGDLEASRASLTRAVDLTRALLPEGSAEGANPRTELALTELAMGDPRAARALSEESVAILDGAGGDPEHLAEAQFVLAQTLPDRQAKRARALAEAARAAYADLGPGYASQVQAIMAWQSAHAAAP